MSKARLIITAVVLEGRTQADVAATYGVSKGWVSKLVARYRTEDEAAFEPHSRRPKTTPNATPAETVELIWTLRRKLVDAGLDAGPDTIGWHLAQDHDVTVSRATIARQLAKGGLVVPSRRSDQSPPTSVSRPRCQTRPGSPISPTTR
ncbi:leucine zipper domain-containing protein [Aeromicrobium sp. A1-2]|uniref:leucine zipper domain-containing protein n=1 Tax=Aeromicrobium sp. A1-2 TaxID=2107713 RepID=UPI001C1FD449|nr:leucine zipper domain-containing protein [Aeromicrobium sp. A1-2]